jgi:glycosyltransferase involved in cell wall biosynthesis
MKIVIFYGGLFSRGGGVVQHIRHLQQGIEERGDDVHIISLESLHWSVRYFPHLVEYFVDIFNKPFGRFARLYLQKYLYKHLVITKGLSESAYIFQDIYSVFKTNSPSVVILHALFSDNLQSFKIRKSVFKKVIGYEIKKIAELQVPIMTVSEAYFRSIEKSLGYSNTKKIESFDLGIDTSKYFLQLHDGAKVNNKILFIGNLEARKNIIFIFDLFEELYRNDNSFTLCFIGGGPLHDVLLRKVRAAGLEDVIDVRGRIDINSIPKEIRKYDILLLPSTKESFAYVLLEAQLSGLHTVATCLDVPGEFIDIALPLDKNLWIDSILNLKHKKKTQLNLHAKYSHRRMTESVLEKLLNT